jgi:prepilin-type N-terminal cleavage/methylation domain-containing protein
VPFGPTGRTSAGPSNKREEPMKASPVIASPSDPVRSVGGHPRGAPAVARRLGLTLIELIVVIAIITILLLIAVKLGQFMVQSTNRKATEALLESVASGCSRYRSERGQYPWDTLYGNEIRWERELTRTRALGGGGTSQQPFFEAPVPTLREQSLDTGTGGYDVINDPWGNPVRVILSTNTAVGGNPQWANYNSNYDHASRWYRNRDIWFDPRSVNPANGTPSTNLWVLNQNAPVFQSAGPNSEFVYYVNRLADPAPPSGNPTALNSSAGNTEGVPDNANPDDDIYSFCGTDF